MKKGGKELFNLDERERELIRNAGVRTHYPKGHVIYAAGDVANRVYLIENGWVKNYRLDAEGRKILAGNIRSPGEMVGIAEALSGGERNSFAAALTDVELVHAPVRDFNNLLEKEHKLAIKISKILAVRLREVQALNHELVCRQVPGRLALMLLRLGERCGVDVGNGAKVIKVRLTHEEIASMIGTSRQTVTSLLNTFKQEKSISIEGRAIKIIDSGKLNSWVV